MRKHRELEPAKLADRQAQKGNVPTRPRSSGIRGFHSMRGTRRTVPSYGRGKRTRGTGKPVKALSGDAGAGNQP